MQNSIKLLSKPPPLSLCRLMYAIHSDRLEELASQSHYVIEDNNGIVAQLYARDDVDCYRKIVDKQQDHLEYSRNSK